jgi:hypothetical protein
VIHETSASSQISELQASLVQLVGDQRMATEEATDVCNSCVSIIISSVIGLRTLTSVFLTQVTEDLVHVGAVKESLGVRETGDTVTTFVGTINSRSIRLVNQSVIFGYIRSRSVPDIVSSGLSDKQVDFQEGATLFKSCTK